MNKSHQVFFQEHFTVTVSLSKAASVYEAAVYLCTLKKVKVIFRAVGIFPDILGFSPLLFAFYC